MEITSKTVKEIDESNEIENLKKIEAALFISARFLNLQELVMLTDVNPLMLKELLEKLIEKYNQEDSAIEIVIKENMWKMDVRHEYVNMINKLATGNSEFTKTEQETLAVIAYKQPVKQSVVIKIRGNKSYEHIKKFIEVGLVQAKRAGHTKDLKLSDDFFEYFHLQEKDLQNKDLVSENKEDEQEEEQSKEQEIPDNQIENFQQEQPEEIQEPDEQPEETPKIETTSTQTETITVVELKAKEMIEKND